MKQFLKYFLGGLLEFFCQRMFSLNLLLIFENCSNLGILAEIGENLAGINFKKFFLMVEELLKVLARFAVRIVEYRF